MNAKGLTLVEGLVAGGLVLVLSVPMLLGVMDTRRRARDAERVSSARQAQAALEAYRARTGSYPSAPSELRSDDAEIVEALSYETEPRECGATLAEACLAYRLRFAIEGPVGSLPGGICTATPQGLSCSR